MTVPPEFAELARRREEASLTACLESFKTTVDNAARFPLEVISCDLTDALLDGPFFQSPVSAGLLPSMNLVFVQSRDGNTEAEDPSVLGGGATDKHVIYEGLSRVAADAVIAGAKTVGDGSVLFSVWHPAFVGLRHALGKPRHPVQIVATLSGALPMEQGLLFNVPEIPVVILSAGRSAVDLASRAHSRPWITVISSGTEADLRLCAERLRKELGIRRISAVGGRTLATGLLDAGLVTDLYLTTSAIEGGTPNTPLYAGSRPPVRDLVVSKRSAEGVVFEHFIVQDSAAGR